jgi:gliding motility-associated-like protein
MKKLLLFFMSIFSVLSYGQFPEGFEGPTFPPTGWIRFDNGIGLAQQWNETTNASLVHSGAKAAFLNRENVTDGTTALDWLVAPQVLVPANGQLRFYTRKTQNGNFGSIYTIRVSTASQNISTDFVTVQTWTEADLVTTYNVYEQKFVNLSAYAGQNIHIAFVMENDNGDRWLVDDVKVDPACQINTAPTAVALSTSATLSWTSPNPTGPWEIEYGPVGFVQGTGTTISVTTNPYVLTGLSPLTSYCYYVRSLCDVDNPSPWTATCTNFQTTALPPVCGGNFVDSGGVAGNYANNENITTTITPVTAGDVVTVFFTSFNTEANWDALYVYDGPSTASPLIASANGAGNVPGGLAGGYWGTTIPGPFTSTHPTGALTFVFRSDSSGVRAGWTSNVTCAPPPPCVQPTGLTVTNVTPDSATLSWTDNNTTPPVGGWQIVIQPAGTGYPTAGSTIINAPTNPFTATNLPPNTPLEYYVLANCGATDGVSFWAGPRSFTTLFPGCGSSTPASDICTTAPPVCDLDGYCGNTSGTYTDASWGALDTAFCGSIENNSFLTFQAASTSISMNVDVGNCTNGSGIQFMIFTTTACGSGAVTDLGCYFNMAPGLNALTFTGLVPGQNYYLMIDGFAGAVCDYAVTVTTGGSTITDVQIAPVNPTICLGETIALTASGGNGVYNWTGTGLSATTGTTVNFVATTPGTYTIVTESTDTNPICSTQNSIEITVLDVLQPTFSNPGQICVGSPNIPLSNTDSNGVTGVWSVGGNPVTEIDASVGGIFTYTFTPDLPAFQCSPIFTMDIEIITSCTFNAFATAVYIDNCETTDPGEFFNITGSGADLIAPATNVYTNNDFGTYVQNSGNLILKGAELKSFKTATSNVCGANMFYRVYLASATPGAFNTLALPFYDDCVGATFPTGGPCDLGDQKWRNIAQAIDLTQNAPGDYIVEVYFDILGDNDSPSQCDDTILVNNAGNNFIANFSIQSAITFTSQNEECGSSNAFITVSGFNPGDIYSVTYNDDTVAVGPANFQANLTGNIIINGLNAGTYDNFNFVINGCSIFEATPIVITNFSPSITQVTNNSPICFGNNATFTIEGTPNFDVDYTINGGAIQTASIDATGFATVTVTLPAVGNVDLALLNIHNSVCNIVVTNTSTVIVNPLPTATLSAPSPFACIGSDAVFTVTGTPNATVTYTINGGLAQSVLLDGTGNATLNIPSTVDVQIILLDVTDGTTACANTISGQISNVAVVTVPVPTANLTQPTCAVQTGVVEVTSPLISQLNYPGNLFISEVTDAQPGSLTYVEIYNGTGASIDLSGYRLKVYTNGNTNPAAGCNLNLSGILANDDVVVIKLSNSANEGGVTPDLTFTTCGAVNNNDKIALTTNTDVEIDVWGTSDGTPFTPSNGVGYNYQRVAIGTTLPSINWDPADWVATDWGSPTSTQGDYSNVGIYTLFVASYEYILSDGTTSTTQPTTTFSGVMPGNYTLVVHDTITNCDSQPYSFTIVAPIFNNPVTTISYSTPVCNDNANLLPDTSASGFTSGGTYSSTAGLTIDPVTGEIDVMGSTPNTYAVTYSVALDAANCLNAGSFTFNVTITPSTTSTFNAITLCEGDVNNVLPTSSVEGFTGTWELGGLPVSTIDTSVAGNYTYDFVPTSGQCASASALSVIIDAKIVVTFSSVEGCIGSQIDFPTMSVEGYELQGTWTPAVINNTVAGATTYTFVPNDICYDQGQFSVTLNACTIPKGFSPNGDGNNDTWNLSAFDIKKVEVFNRYGLKVYSKTSYTDEWSGKADNGNELPTGTYYFMIEFNDRPSETGWVYINRGE